MQKTPAKPTKPAVRHSPMEHPRLRYPQETAALQDLARSCGLTETIKWGKPCFTLGDKNIALIQPFKHYLALLFFKGALLSDPDKLLFPIGKAQSPRQLRFTSVEEITKQTATIKAFIQQAIALEHSGAKLERKAPADLNMPEELQARLAADPVLKKAFHSLTPGRQKGYIYQIASAKQAATRTARVDKYTPQILAGKGLND